MIKKKEDDLIKPIESFDEIETGNFWNSIPSYQNSVSAIKRSIDALSVLGAFQKDILIGYIVFLLKPLE